MIISDCFDRSSASINANIDRNRRLLFDADLFAKRTNLNDQILQADAISCYSAPVDRRIVRPAGYRVNAIDFAGGLPS